MALPRDLTNLVDRGGFGLFYNSFENQGYGPNIGENYPFVYNFDYKSWLPIRECDSGRATQLQHSVRGVSDRRPGRNRILGVRILLHTVYPCDVMRQVLGLQGLQFDYHTPRTYSANATVQYSVTRTLSATASYVYTHGENLQAGVGYQNVTAILPSQHGQVHVPYHPM